MTKTVYLVAGFLFVGIAALGFVLPVLPGTPFLLLAAWCFARSSERWHRWLLNSELFGPIISNWEENRCISIRTKMVAIGSMVLVGGASVVFAIDQLWLRVLAGLLMTAGAVTVLMIPTCESEA